jgi:2-deoxy-D-gluconate 3-dehydrogenase
MNALAKDGIPGFDEMIVKATPAARWGSADDFRGIAVFLASNASDFVTGVAITVDGGFTTNLF